MEANASKGKNYNEERLDNMINRLLEEAERIDNEEDKEFGEREDNIPDELGDPDIRRARIKELIEEAKRKKEIVKEEIERKEKQ